MEADVSRAQKSSTWGGAIELAVCRSARLLHRAASFTIARCLQRPCALSSRQSK